jgi:hypothetical protein
MKTLALIALFLGLTSFYSGNAAANVYMKPTCLKTEAITNMMAPPELYGYTQACLKEKKNDQAALLFFIAATYAAYDFERVENEKKIEMLQEIGQTFSKGQTDDENKAFGEFLRNQMVLPQTMYPLCQQILNVGPPMYQPTYLLASDLKDGDKGYKTELDIPLTWLTAVGMATKCTVKNLQLDKNYKP